MRDKPAFIKARFTVLLIVGLAFILTYVYTSWQAFHHHHHPRPVRQGGQDSNWSRNSWVRVNSDTQVFSAYFEERKTRYHFGKAVVIFGIQNVSDTSTFYCLIDLGHHKSCLKRPVTKYLINAITSSIFLEYCYVCQTSSEELPLRVALSMNSNCTHSSPWVPITYSKHDGDMKTFGVCIQTPVFAVQNPQSVVEAIEMHRLLGAEHFTLYIHSVTARVMDVLETYAEEGLVEIVNWRIGRPFNESVYYYGENSCMNECIYRNMYKVKYLVFVDLDEVIVPQKASSWSEMMKGLDQPTRGSFEFRNVFYYKPSKAAEYISCDHAQRKFEIPRVISYTSRSNVVEDYEYRSKIIIKPPVTVRIGVHLPFEHLSGYSVYRVPSEVGLVHHYRFPALYENRAKSPDHRMKDFHSPLLTAVKQKFCLH